MKRFISAKSHQISLVVIYVIFMFIMMIQLIMCTTVQVDDVLSIHVMERLYLLYLAYYPEQAKLGINMIEYYIDIMSAFALIGF